MAGPMLASSQTIRILLLEDNQADADLCVRKQKSTGLQMVVDVARAAQEFVGTGRFPNLRRNSFRSPRFRLEWTRCLQVVPVIGLQHAAHCGYGSIRGRTRYRVH